MYTYSTAHLSKRETVGIILSAESNELDIIRHLLRIIKIQVLSNI